MVNIPVFAILVINFLNYNQKFPKRTLKEMNLMYSPCIYHTNPFSQKTQTFNKLALIFTQHAQKFNHLARTLKHHTQTFYQLAQALTQHTDPLTQHTKTFNYIESAFTQHKQKCTMPNRPQRAWVLCRESSLSFLSQV